MAEASKGMDGAEKAAIFLMVIGEASAAEVMKHLGPREVQKIGVAMSGLEVVSPSNVIFQSVGVKGATTSSPQPQQQLCADVA